MGGGSQDFYEPERKNESNNFVYCIEKLKNKQIAFIDMTNKENCYPFTKGAMIILKVTVFTIYIITLCSNDKANVEYSIEVYPESTKLLLGVLTHMESQFFNFPIDDSDTTEIIISTASDQERCLCSIVTNKISIVKYIRAVHLC